MAPRPQLLLLDEPLSALDAPTRLHLRGELRGLLRQLALPTIIVTHDWAEALTLGDRIAVIADPYGERETEIYASSDGIIIDLRGNPGGVGAMVMGTSGHFLTSRVSLGTLKTRDRDMRYMANPRLVGANGRRVQPFAGPVAVLIDDSRSMRIADVDGRPRADAVLMSGPAIPLVGDVMRFTVSPLVSRLLWPGFVKKVFSPRPVADSFRRWPKWLSLRPSQLRAASAESVLMIPAAAIGLVTAVVVPDGPGLGVELDEDRVAFFRRDGASRPVHVVPNPQG